MTVGGNQTAETTGFARPAASRRAGALASLSRDLYVDGALIAALAVLLVVFGVASNGREFLESNLVSILDAGSILGVVTIGEVIVMISGSLDISVGSNAGLVTAAMAQAMAHSGASLALGLVVGIVVGLLAGAVNGAAVAYARVNSVIATLATYSAYLGVALLVTNGQEIGINSSALGTLGTGSVVSVPYLVIVLIAATAIAMTLMRHSLGGHRVYAVGGSQQASMVAGIKVQRYVFTVFLLSGLCAAIAGVMLAAQTGTAQPTEGSVGLELTAITAVLLGGTGLSGGTGTVFGAILGVLVLSTLDNGLLLVGVPAFWQEVATGAVLMIAVLLQDFSGHRSRLRALQAARRRARRAAGAVR
jgi:ribose/xylose/arabinose/galactoside ABC-type transport system permease subunit